MFTHEHDHMYHVTLGQSVGKVKLAAFRPYSLPPESTTGTIAFCAHEALFEALTTV